MLLGLSLRHAVTVVSPLLSTIQRDIGLDQVGATILGMLPTIAFGIAGFIAPTVIRAVGPPQAAVLAMGLGALATLVRVTAHGPTLFLVCGAVALFGMGMGNVVGPPLVKRYFADRQGTTMTLLVLTMQGGATIPAMLAVPVAAAASWRVSVGWWAILMIAAAVPWVSAIMKGRPAPSEQPAGSTPTKATYGARILFRNPISAGAALFYGMAALNTYAMLAWRFRKISAACTTTSTVTHGPAVESRLAALPPTRSWATRNNAVGIPRDPRAFTRGACGTSVRWQSSDAAQSYSC